MPKKRLQPGNSHSQATASSSSNTSSSTDTASLAATSQRSDDTLLQHANSPMSLREAARMNDIEVASRRLEQSNIVIDAVNEYGETALHIAAGHGHLEMARLLLEQGANIHAAKKDGATPLHFAAGLGHLKVVRLLLASDANIDVASTVGATPLHVAAHKGHLEVVQLLLDNGANIHTARTDAATPLHAAAQDGHVEVVQLLLDNGANIDVASPAGVTPLHAAVHNGHLEAVRLLLKQGATIDFAMSEGRTPLHTAAQNGHLEVVQLLLDNGANIHATWTDKATPLHAAAQNGHLEVVRLLLEQGANIHATWTDGATPLYIAAQNGYLEVVRLLLEQGAAINAPVADGRTPLHAATQNGHIEVVRFLLEQGAAINAADTVHAATPLYIAASQGHLEVVEVLLCKGANIYAKAKGGLDRSKCTLEMAIEQYNQASSSTDPKVQETCQARADIISQFFLGGFYVEPGVSTLIDAEIARRGQINRKWDLWAQRNEGAVHSAVPSLSALALPPALFFHASKIPQGIHNASQREIMPLFYDLYGAHHCEITNTNPNIVLHKLSQSEPWAINNWLAGAGEKANQINPFLIQRFTEQRDKSMEHLREIAALREENERLKQLLPETSLLSHVGFEGNEGTLEMISDDVTLHLKASSDHYPTSSSSSASSSSARVSLAIDADDAGGLQPKPREAKQQPNEEIEHEPKRPRL